MNYTSAKSFRLLHLASEEKMANIDSYVTIHMVASLDGFIARKDGSTDWMETQDEFVGGDTMDTEFIEAFLKTIDCYAMGSRTYETALSFEAKGLGWSYGDKPTFVPGQAHYKKIRGKELQKKSKNANPRKKLGEEKC